MLEKYTYPEIRVEYRRYRPVVEDSYRPELKEYPLRDWYYNL